MFATKLRAKENNGVTHAIALINHPMKSGLLRVDSEHRRSPCFFITNVGADNNRQNLMTAQWSGAISQHPVMEFRFAGGRKGDTLSLRWIDNAGNRGQASTSIS